PRLEPAPTSPLLDPLPVAPVAPARKLSVSDSDDDFFDAELAKAKPLDVDADFAPPQRGSNRTFLVIAAGLAVAVGVFITYLVVTRDKPSEPPKAKAVTQERPRPPAAAAVAPVTPVPEPAPVVPAPVTPPAPVAVAPVVAP